MKARFWQKTAAAMVTVLSLSVVGAGDSGLPATESAGPDVLDAGAASASSQADTNSGPTRIIPPAKITLPTQLSEVVRLAQSGVDESVIQSYIRNSPVSSSPTAEQIVYLRDMGISSEVLQALVEHNQAGTAPTAESIASGAGSDAYAPESTAAQANEVQTGASGPEAASVNYNYFYDSLAPYGSWSYWPAYGWCWQPTVVVVNPFWRPYCDGGGWLWSDCGWYWNSFYSWGWAPFHFGRWFCHPRCGWCWCPDRVWGPAWVCWRSAPGFCGWAPLPPRARFTPGIGLTFNGVAVGVNFGFGLASSAFTFVAHDHFTDRHPFHHFLPRHNADAVFNRTTVINNIVIGSNNRIINRGIDRQQIEAATHSPIHEVTVRELPRGANPAATLDRMERAGNSLVVYRPNPQAFVPRNPLLSGLNSRQEFGEASRTPPPQRPSGGQGEAPRGGVPTVPGGQWTGQAGPPRHPSVEHSEGRPDVERNPSPANPHPAPDMNSRPTRATPNLARPQSMNQSGPTPGWQGYGFGRGREPRSSTMQSVPAPNYHPYYSRKPEASWPAPRTFSAPPNFSGRSFSSPAYASQPAPSFGGMYHAGGISGGVMASGHGTNRRFGIN